jgi:subtilisin family serine protease
MIIVLLVSMCSFFPTCNANFDARPILSGSRNFEDFFGMHGLNGLGEVLCIMDSGIDDMHAFFVDDSNTPTPRSLKGDVYHDRRKVIQYIGLSDDNDSIGHGTHVAASAMGAPTKDHYLYSFRGVAPGAKVSIYDIAYRSRLVIPFNLTNAFEMQKKSGCAVFSHSWGTTVASTKLSYHPYTSSVDRFLYENDENVMFFAAGNSNQNVHGCSNGNIGTPANSKNGIAVGGLTVRTKKDYRIENIKVASFSSQGPVGKGRMKPDVCGNFMLDIYIFPLIIF